MCVTRVALLLLEILQALVDGSKDVTVILCLCGAVGQPVEVSGVVCTTGTQLTAHPEPKQVGQDAGQLEFSPVAFGFLRVAH